MTDATDNARGAELLPCPFCRGKDVDTNLHEDGRVHCYRCGADGPAIPYARDDKATTWNTRALIAPDPLADPRIKALAGIMQRLVGEYADDAEFQARFAHENRSYEEADQAQSTAELWRKARAALAALEGGKTDG